MLRAGSTLAKPWILGISSAFHNGAACLLKGDEIVVAVQEERLTRIKRDRIRHDEPSLAIKYCLEAANIKLRDLDLIVDCTISFPTQSQEESLTRGPLLQALEGQVEVVSLPHHLGHAVSAFATSGFDESAVLVIDGGGSFGWQLPESERKAALACSNNMCEHLSIYHATGNGVIAIEKHMSYMPYLRDLMRGGMPEFASLGHMYSSTALQIFGDYLEAGKVMGLAPYGNPAFPISDFLEYDSGKFRFSDHISRKFPRTEPWLQRQQEHKNLAASVQQALEYALREIVSKMDKMGLGRNLSYAGGVALNSVANHKVFKHSRFTDIHIIPAAEDSGPAIGAAYYGLSLLTEKNYSRRLQNDFLGRKYSAEEIDMAIETLPALTVVETDNLLDSVVELLCDGKVVAWFQGGAEFGPRSLGHRSILYDPRRVDAKQVLNERVKHREGFRPFAPAILAEKVNEWFETEAVTQPMDFMLEVCRFKDGPVNSDVPGVTHVDRTGRLQSVRRRDNSEFYMLIERFYLKTGVPIILNTSMNIMGEPIVETPTEALWLLLSTGVDCCVLGDRIVTKVSSFHSVLDLVPHSTCEVISSNGDLGVVRVRTEHGPMEYKSVPAELIETLERIDGKASGRELFKDADSSSNKTQHGCSILGQLFRYCMIRFNGDAKPEGISEHSPDLSSLQSTHINPRVASTL